MAGSDAKRDQNTARMIELSVPHIRETNSKLSTISARFAVRAATDTLPTYHNEYKKVLTSTAYKSRYRDLIDGGLCPFCGVPETLSHVLTECTIGTQIRSDTHQKIQTMWRKKTKDALAWALNSHFMPNCPLTPGWEEWWYWLGLVPLSGWTNKPPITQSLIKDTAKVLAEAGFALWTNRIEATKKWETTVGIGPHKDGPHPPPARPDTRDQPPAKRGRPSKLDEDRSQPYRDLLARRKRVHNLLQVCDASGSPIFTTKAAKHKARQDGIRERKARALSQLAVTLNLRNITRFPALPAQIPAVPLDVATITRAISSNTPIIATPLTQGALLQFNRKASNRRQRPVILEYEIERIIADRTLSKHREFLCKWKDYPLHQSSWIQENLLTNARDALTQYLNPPVVPPSTNPNLTSTHPDICQVICCGRLATAPHPACKIQPPSARCSKHTLVACKEATSCRCSLDADPPVTGTCSHQPLVTPPPSIPTSNRYQPLACSNPDPPEYEVEKIVAARVTSSGVQQYYVKWIGYTPHHNTWEDAVDLTHAPGIVGDFLSIVPDPPPPLTQCQAKLCSLAAVSEFPRCSATPQSMRCAKHSCVPCGPATYCPCQPQNKRHRPLTPPTNHPEPPSPKRPTLPAPPNIPQSHTFSSPLDTVPEQTHFDNTMAHASLPLPPHPPNECPPPAPRAPSHRNSRSKRALLDTELPQPPPAQRQRPRPEPPTRGQSKRTHPDSEFTRSPPAKKTPTQTSNAPALGRNKKGSKRVARQGPRKKKTPHI